MPLKIIFKISGFVNEDAVNPLMSSGNKIVTHT